MAKMLKKFVGLGPVLIKGFSPFFVLTTVRMPCNLFTKALVEFYLFTKVIIIQFVTS